MKQFYTPAPHPTARPQHSFRALIHAVALATLTVLLTALGVALVWGWLMGLLFVLGGLFFATCCFLSYYSRISFSFNNLADTNQSTFLAFFTNSIPHRQHHSSPPEEPFQPFKFASTSEVLETEKEQQELEDMRVRALLRQVFPEDEQ